MEEPRSCREQRDLLKARERRHQEAEHAYKTARTNLLLGEQQQKILVLELKLESAVEDKELMEIQVSALESQLHEERKWLTTANQKVEDLYASFPVMVASKSKKLVAQAERKVHRLRKVLNDNQESHKEEVRKLQEQHNSTVTQLKEEVQLWISRHENLHKHRNLDWKELQVLLQSEENLSVEQEWILKEKKIQEITDDRDKLLSEKDKWIKHEQELQAAVKEMDTLSVEKERWMSQMQQLGRERDKLKHELELSTKHEQGIESLIRERNFVWSQMKKMEDGYSRQLKKKEEDYMKQLKTAEGQVGQLREKEDQYVEQVKKMSGQILEDRQEIERLRHERQELVKEMVDTTILKMEGRYTEDLAIQKQEAFEADLQELRSNLEKVKKENIRLIAHAMTTDALLLELTSQKEALKKELDMSYQAQEEGVGAGAVKDGPEVLNVNEGLIMDQEMFESQVEQAIRVDNDNYKKVLKSLEEVRHENENLRILIAQQEVLHKEKQGKKPIKGAGNTNYRDPTSRNLKSELEAAATSCRSDKIPISHRKSWKMRRPDSNPEDQSLPTSTSSAQRKSKVESTETIDLYPRRTRHSKRLLSDGKPSEKIAIPSTGTSILGGQAAHWDATPWQQNFESVQKRARRKTDEKAQSDQEQRPPLCRPPSYEKSDVNPSVRRPSSKRTFHDSENNEPGPGTNEKMMANLFSAAFSFPILKKKKHQGLIEAEI